MVADLILSWIRGVRRYGPSCQPKPRPAAVSFGSTAAAHIPHSLPPTAFSPNRIPVGCWGKYRLPRLIACRTSDVVYMMAQPGTQPLPRPWSTCLPAHTREQNSSKAEIPSSLALSNNRSNSVLPSMAVFLAAGVVQSRSRLTERTGSRLVRPYHANGVHEFGPRISPSHLLWHQRH